MTDTNPNDIDEFFSSDRVSARGESVALPQASYREFLYDLADPVLAPYRGMDYETFTKDRQGAQFLLDLLDYWNSLMDEPFVGITSDGQVRDGLYVLPNQNQQLPQGVTEAQALLASLTDEQRAKISYPLDSPQWRAWSNPEFVFHRNGLRLEDQDEDTNALIMGVVRSCMSAEAFERVCEAMALNGFLGELVDLPLIMNDRSYWFSLFGTPDTQKPWGWQLFGHHLAVNFVAVGGRHVFAPVFIGAEPALSEGTRPPLFDKRESVALELASSFDEQQRQSAIVYASVLDPAMPEGRLHPADERHVAGAFRDNRVVPYEGIVASALNDNQQALLDWLVEDFHLLLIEAQREQTMAEYRAHLDETWFSWYGATDGSEPFYFRIQSPVILAELDHHAGVWLNNRLPARFHVHTTLRLPNGNDYGKALIRAHDSQTPLA